MQTPSFDGMETPVTVPVPSKDVQDGPTFWIGVGRGKGEEFQEAWWPGYARVGVTPGERTFYMPESTERSAVPMAQDCPLCRDGSCRNWGVLLTDIAVFNNDNQRVKGATMSVGHFLSPGFRFIMDFAL